MTSIVHLGSQVIGVIRRIERGGLNSGLTLMALAWGITGILAGADALDATTTTPNGSGFVAGSVVISTLQGTPRAVLQMLCGLALLLAAGGLWAGLRQAFPVLLIAAAVAGVASTSVWVPGALAALGLVGTLPLLFTSALDQLWPPTSSKENQ
ncbi:MAG: hypothetical protein JWR52_1130 [Marmoricola sp.]|nr:hypothetical protein [Marmoricola sp.]